MIQDGWWMTEGGWGGRGLMYEKLIDLWMVVDDGSGWWLDNWWWLDDHDGQPGFILQFKKGSEREMCYGEKKKIKIRTWFIPVGFKCAKERAESQGVDKNVGQAHFPVIGIPYTARTHLDLKESSKTLYSTKKPVLKTLFLAAMKSDGEFVTRWILMYKARYFVRWKL